MLLLIFISLCVPSSLALVDSIHNTEDTGDLYPMVRQDQFEKNFVVFEVFNDFKTGENISDPSYSTRFGVYPGLYWESSHRDEDDYPDEEAVACAYRDVDPYRAYQKQDLVSDQSRIEVGQSRMSANGTVRVKCRRFDGHVRRVSEALSGCYYNGTVYRIHEEWDEPNPGNDSSLWKVMSCERSENGYFESKLVRCSIHKTHSWTNADNSVGSYVIKRDYILNIISDRYREGQWKKCVESEPGVAKIEEVPDYEPVCKVDTVVFKDFYDDDVKGVRWECINGQIYKRLCIIGKNRYVDAGSPVEHKLSNGCRFICHPQTNIFKCDEALSMFKVEGKPRKLRKYEGSRFGRRWYRYGSLSTDVRF